MQNKASILIIPLWYPNKDNPNSGIFIKNQAHALASKGLNIIVLYREWGRGKTRKIVDGHLTEIFFRIKKLKPKIISYPIYLFFLIKYIILYKKKNNEIVIHAHVAIPNGLISILLGKIFNLPVVITCHSSSHFQHKNIFQRWLIKISIKYSDKFLSVGHVLKRRLENISGIVDKIEVVPNHVDCTKFLLKGSSSPEVFKLIYIANFSEAKGHIVLLNALRLLIKKDKVSNISLTLAGAGQTEDIIKHRAKQLGIVDHIKFIGHVEHEKIPMILKEHHVFVHPSYYETFGVVLIEAMACGMPVVATKCGEPEYIVKDFCGVLVPIKDHIKFADSIKKIIDNYSTYNGSEIRDYIKRNYSNKFIAQKINEIYNETIRKYMTI